MPFKNDDEVILVCEWDSETFHRRVLELGAKGYLSRQESYKITPETNPETGKIIHLHSIEMFKPGSDQNKSGNKTISE
jgi:hypothetical protein